MGEQKQRRNRQRSRPEGSHKTQEMDEETQSEEEETKRYANHVPGELERLLEEFADAYEITEEQMGQWEKPGENANQKGHAYGSRGEKRKTTKQNAAPEATYKCNHNRTEENVAKQQKK